MGEGGKRWYSVVQAATEAIDRTEMPFVFLQPGPKLVQKHCEIYRLPENNDKQPSITPYGDQILPTTCIKQQFGEE